MSKKTEKLSFEDALERLETLIESIESGDTSLDELVNKFEEGVTLLQNCQKKLKTAELTIEKLNLETGELNAFNDSEKES